MRRYVSVRDAEWHVDADYRLAEQVEQDDLYRETGFALDLLSNALREARRRPGDEVDEETRDALDRAELALVDALDSRAETVAEQEQERLDDLDEQGGDGRVDA